jgi:hypothetical protein
MTDVRYYRTKGGSMVHRAGCHRLSRARTAHPWHWAERYGDDIERLWSDVDMNVGIDQIRFCHDCCPEVPRVRA